MKHAYTYIILFLISCLSVVSCKKRHSDLQSHIFPKKSDSLSLLIKNEPLKMIHFCDSIILNQSEFGDLDLGIAHLQKGSAYNTLNDYHQAHSNFKEALKLFRVIDNKEYIVKTLSGLSSVNIRLDNFTKAIEQGQQALMMAIELNDKILISNVYSSLSYLYYANGNYLKALTYVEESIQNLENTKRKESLASAYNNLAILYRNMMRLDDAMWANKKSLEINEAISDIDGIATSHTNIGILLRFQGRYEESIPYFKKSIDIYKTTDITNSKPYEGLYDTYKFMGKNDSAKVYIDEALKIEEKKGNLNALQGIYNKLFNNSLKIKDYEKSLLYKEKLDEIEHKIESDKDDERIAMLEQQAVLLQNKFDLEVARSNQRVTRIVIFSLSLLILFVILFFMQMFKATKLNHQKNKNQLELKVLRSQMNPHFIFNALSAIQNTVMDGEPIKSASYLSRFAKLIRQNFEFTSKELITLQNDIEALKNYIETQLIRFEDQFEYSIYVDDDLDTNSVYIPPMLLQPFIENAIEHGFKGITRKGMLSISISSNTNEQLWVEIIDNGKGYTPNNDGKLHSTSITKRRLSLLNKGDEERFRVVNLGAELGTKVSFTISY